MTDIVERLRDWSEYDEGKINDAREEAADEITRLRAEVEKMRADIAYADKHAVKVEGLLWGTAKENERLRAALEKICNGPRDADLDYVDLFVEVKIEARAALEEK